MPRGKDKGRLAPFVPLLKDTLDSQAWMVLSFGARLLYLALKRRVPPQRNTAYLSYRNAAKELGSTNFRKVGEWYRELEFYGFIVLHRYGSLGVEGRGKSPQWRLTELGVAATSEEPTRDFLRWDGVLFEPKPRPNRLSTLPTPLPAPVPEDRVVKSSYVATQVTGNGRSMCQTQVTLRNGGVADAGDTTVATQVTGCPNAGDGILFSGVTRGVNTSGDEQELVRRFLAALDQR